MLKFRKNLRKVATIIACLVVTTMLASCDGKNGDDDNGDGSNSPIVGMWRSSLGSGSSGVTVGSVFFNADGTYLVIRYRYNQFNGIKGKYRLKDNTLEIYDQSWFQKGNNTLSADYLTVEFLRERFDIIEKGTRSEVLAIIDPNHSIWQHYGAISGQVGWMDADSETQTVEWVDANTIDYQNGLVNPLKRVK